MTTDEDFEPKLGPPRGDRGAPARSGGRRARFTGGRIGRGAGVGRVLHSRDRFGAFRARRVVIQTRIVKIMGHGTNRVRLHLRYIQREGVTRDGSAGVLYDARDDKADGRAFVERTEGDRHQFRFIVSPEDGDQYDDLNPFVRKLMRQMETDLGTKLDWVAVDHYNTGHPHTHIVLRGKDEMGADLVIAREYISHGMRERAAEIASLDLGPRTDLEIQSRLRREVDQERFTSLDRDLLRQSNAERIVSATGEAFRQSLRAGRLRKLERLGLAEEIRPNTFRLAADLQPTLQRLGERGDIIKTLHREMTAKSAARAMSAYAIYDPSQDNASRLVGKVVGQGMADAVHDRPYLIVDAADGKCYFVPTALRAETEPNPVDTVVSITSRPVVPKPADRVIAEVAATREGRYSAELHLRHDPSATPAFVEAHIRRLEALRKLGGITTREPDGTWTIPSDYLVRAQAHEKRRAQSDPVRVQILSATPLEQQAHADGATWLDRELVTSTRLSIAPTGFGKDVQDALDRRCQWLISQGLARAEGDVVIYPHDLIENLRRRELVRVAAQLSGELNLPYSETQSGQRIEGIYRHRLDLTSGRFALIAGPREFTLVPWRDVLERSAGHTVCGIMSADTVSWSIGRQRSRSSIT